VLDPRVKVIGIHNTGVIDPGRRHYLKEIKQPIGYFYGGSSDFSESFVGFLPNNFVLTTTDISTKIQQDYREIPDSLPAMMSSIDAGHGGTYSQPNGGKSGKATLAFFKWQLQGDKASREMFFNKSSQLYKDGWKINTSHWRDLPGAP
jgi:hypothetical protein